jgi:Tfp pilus assembly protein PilO
VKRPLNLPTGIPGRCLALALLLAMLGLAYVVVAVPVVEIYSEREAALAQRRMLEPRLRAAAEEVPGLRVRLAELQASTSNRKITIDGSTDAIASANLQSRIDELATSVGVTVASTEGLAPENRGAYRRIGLRIALNGEYDNVLALLAGIEKAAPPLVIDNLQIHARLQAMAMMQSPLMQRSPVAPAATRLDAALEVYGFRRQETPLASSK